MLGAMLSGCIPSTGYRGEVYDRPAPDPRAQPRAAQRESPAFERRSIDQDIRALPAPPPAWEARTVVPDARRVAASTYVVQRDDSLRGIAVKTGAGSEAIARANGIRPPYMLRPGQRLLIPGGLYHQVRAGDTGIAIARAYGVSWSRVITANALEEPYVLRMGQRLLIPDTGPETREQRAARFHIDIDDILTGGEPALARNTQPTAPTASSARVLPPTAAVKAPVRLTGQFAWPARGNLVKRFGPGASGERSDGIKIAVPLDTPVLAAADGVVAYVGSDVPALGGLVILKHGAGWTSVYGHASQLLVQRGQAVKKGQMIALSGNSGFADRPELHFELREGRTPVDPVPRLPPR